VDPARLNTPDWKGAPTGDKLEPPTGQPFIRPKAGGKGMAALQGGPRQLANITSAYRSLSSIQHFKASLIASMTQNT